MNQKGAVMQQIHWMPTVNKNVEEEEALWLVESLADFILREEAVFLLKPHGLISVSHQTASGGSFLSTGELANGTNNVQKSAHYQTTGHVGSFKYTFKSD